jgi:quercetin dioxygenase-like cupin family protein
MRSGASSASVWRADAVTDRGASARLETQAVAATRWGNGAGDRYGAHEHSYDKVIVVEKGSITFELTAEGRSIELADGDRLELPAGTRHAAVVGPVGVSCVESHLPSGSFAAARRIESPGRW